MKKIVIFILFVNIVFTTNAQSDTLQQQLRVEQNIAKYTGKPFSLLYNDLIIKPKSVWGALTSKNINVERAHQFFYEIPDSVGDTYIYIEWQEPLLISETQKYQPYFLRVFNAQEYPTYADKIIKKLQVYSTDPNGLVY